MTNVKLEQYDDWLQEGSDVAALVMRQWLEPVEGKDAVIFPPTYPINQNEAGYNIDHLSDGTTVCQIDSVGSQANRMEPIFKRDKYKHLVPQVTVKATVSANGQSRVIHLLDAGHRAADAIVRFSTLGPELHEAFQAFCQNGDAEKLARIAPTSIVFGAWDSRATQAKLPRIVRSVIRAFDVEQLHRSAQYTTIAGEILAAGSAEVTTKGPKAELGLAHVPAVMKHGGILVKGEIRREAILSFVPLRALGSESHNRGDDIRLRRYIFGLALVAFTARPETFLREGCELVPSEDRAAEWKLVNHDGARSDWRITHEDALAFVTAAAEAFGVKQPNQDQEWEFDRTIANDVLNLNEEARKALLRQGPVTKEAINRLRQKGKSDNTKAGAQEA
ncbi:MAG: type I-U CRISPR-associated RAMP protein Csb1/Cas7u [Chloroflexi bacterium]|nr:type I-U CRISPR-associated RAMP protein Csb1/Cas7u [Chloroflexota bacterium]